MCEDCWDELGRPLDDGPDIERAAALIRELYAVEPTGGPLHAELDDWNIEGPIIGDGGFSEEPTPEIITLVDELRSLLQGLGVRARASALAKARGFSPDEDVASRE